MKTKEEFEAGLKEYVNGNHQVIHPDLLRLAAQYYATIQERKGEWMFSGEIEQKFIEQFPTTAKELGPLRVREICLFIQPLTTSQPRPVEDGAGSGYPRVSGTTANNGTLNVAVKSVEGGLTREWLSEAWDDDDLNSVDKVLDAIWSRIEAERKVIEKKVRSEFTTKIIGNSATITGLNQTIGELRAELADLKANSIPLPKWDDADEKEGAEVCGAMLFAMYRDAEGCVKRGVALTKMFPRPTPEREMTPDEMADKWIERYLEDNVDAGVDCTPSEARHELFTRLLNGKPIQQLMQEAGLKTTKKEGV